MYKLAFYVPVSHLDAVKNAVFAAGAGRIGQYQACCWQTLGEGQFQPMAGAQPFVGDIDRLETVAEYKVEMVCADAYLDAAVVALREAHPYEEPAVEVWRLERC